MAMPGEGAAFYVISYSHPTSTPIGPVTRLVWSVQRAQGGAILPRYVYTELQA